MSANNKPTGDNPLCPRCKTVSNLFSVKKDSQNKGRWFYTCPCNNFFQWADARPSNGRAATQSASNPSQQPAAPTYGSQGVYGTNPTSPISGTQYGSQPSQYGSQPSTSAPSHSHANPTPSPQAAAGSSGGHGATAGTHSNKPTVHLQLMPGSRFAAKVPFNEEFIAHVKALHWNHRSWDGEARMWTFPMAQYDHVVEHLRSGGFPVELIPEKVKDSAASTSQAHERDPAIESEIMERLSRTVGADTLCRLYPFQKEGVRFGLRVHGRLLLADDMGLGKTVQAICIAAAYPEDWPLLVVCPSSMRLVWQSALRDWLPKPLLPEPQDLWTLSNGKDLDRKLDGPAAHPTKHVCITSYDLVQKLGGAASRYGIIICDESHQLKTPTAQRTQFVAKLVKKSKRAILITGTPILSRPIEAWSQVDMLRPGLLGSYHEYGERYCVNPDQQAHSNSPSWFPGQQYRGATRLDELHTRLSGVMIRRTKEEVLDDLPDKLRQRVTVPVDPACKAPLARILAAMNAAEERGDDTLRKQLLTEYYQATGPAKVGGVWQVVEGLLDRGNKIIIFAHHHSVLDAMASRLQQYSEAAGGAAGTAGTAGTQGDREEPEGDGGASSSKGKAGKGKKRKREAKEGGDGGVPFFVRIDGNTSDAKRDEACKSYQKKDACRVALLSITAAGVGITLTEAKAVVFAELYWNPGSLIQAEDRAHRLGQKSSVAVYYALAERTCDDIIWKLVKSKLNVLGRALDNSTARGMHEASPEQMARWQQEAAQTASPHQRGRTTPNHMSTGQHARPSRAPSSPVPLHFPPDDPVNPLSNPSTSATPVAAADPEEAAAAGPFPSPPEDATAAGTGIHHRQPASAPPANSSHAISLISDSDSDQERGGRAQRAALGSASAPRPGPNREAAIDVERLVGVTAGASTSRGDVGESDAGRVAKPGSSRQHAIEL